MKRLYFKDDWSEEMCRMWYKSIVMEQDYESPHCYFDKSFFERNKVFGTVLDIGCAEGNFSLSVIEKVEKVYYFEPDSTWEKAINRTFKDYHEKLVWVKKAVGRISEGNVVSVDDYFGEYIPENISIIKMDIDGYEADAICGMKKTLAKNPNATILATVYHHQNDEEKVAKALEEIGYRYTIRKGYMIFDFNNLRYPYLRHGVIEAKKRIC